MNSGADILILADDNPVQGHNLPLWLVDVPLGLSGKAFGFLVYLVTRPPGTRLNIDSLTQHFADKRTAVASGLNELEKAGYLRRDQARNQGGSFSGQRWHVAFTPRFAPDSAYENPAAENLLPVRKPGGGKPASGVDSPQAENLLPVRKPASGKPDSGQISGPVFSVDVAVKQDVATEITNQIVSGEYRFAAGEAPLNDLSLLSNTVSTVKEEVLTEQEEGVGKPKPRTKTDWRRLTAEQQLIWDEGWAKGYALHNGIPPSAPSLHACVQFKEVCKKMLDATAGFARQSGRPPAEVAAAQLYSCFERSQLFTEWEQRNFFTRPQLFAANFDTIRSTLKTASKPKGAAARPAVSPEEYARQQEARRYQNAVARGHIRPGDELPAPAPAPAASSGPPRPFRVEDLVPDGE